MYIKTVKVTNPKNVIVQIPKFVVENWGLNEKDGVEVHINSEEKYLILKPRKGYSPIRTRINTD
jgi:bifunctional DNA-binding transcriptional regulator/antitoxin component of YhaV-PrlF toxin-antitoxin module